MPLMNPAFRSRYLRRSCQECLGFSPMICIETQLPSVQLIESLEHVQEFREYDKVNGLSAF
jgi:hypothetical protein